MTEAASAASTFIEHLSSSSQKHSHEQMALLVRNIDYTGSVLLSQLIGMNAVTQHKLQVTFGNTQRSAKRRLGRRKARAC